MFTPMTLVISSIIVASSPIYPDAPRGNVTDTYHGVTVPDPYRWLEADVRQSDAVRTWVTNENITTRSYLDTIPELETIRAKLTESWNYAKYGTPWHRGSRWFQSRNTGLQNHSVIFTGDSPTSINHVMLDPNTLSADGTKALSMFSPSPDGKYLAWGVADAGSDWSTWYLKDLDADNQLPEILHHIKTSTPSWLPDESGFYYTRYPDDQESDDHLGTTDGSQLWLHLIGTSQDVDTLIWSDPAHADRFYGPSVTLDGGWLVVTVSQGTSSDNAILIKGPNQNQLLWLIPDYVSAYELIGGVGNKLWFKTDHNAPNGKVVAIDFDDDFAALHDVIPENEHILRSADIVGGKITVSWLVDAATNTTIHTLEGKQLFEVNMPGLGTASGFGGSNSDTTVYWSYSSYNQPPSIYSLNLDTNETELYWQTDFPIDLTDVVVRREFVTSSDGEKVPIFITSKKNTKLDGNNAVLLYGYGGFDISILPRFSASRATWIDMGGVYVVANIRGGSEYGRRWHEGGMLLNKQQVFDDFIASAQWLIDHKWTQPSKLGIQGGSNGGLLVGACMTQRPDLFGACLPAVGVMDMLRFPLFTVGWAWTSDYGSPDDPTMFANLYSYSPYHNVKDGTCYPPTLVTTGDTDDRVVPSHSFKFAAALQHAQSCDNQALIRIETRAGHGAGKPTSLLIEELADVYAFLYRSLGMGK